MVIDTYSIGVGFKVDYVGLRNLGRTLTKLESRVKNLSLSTGLNNKVLDVRFKVNRDSVARVHTAISHMETRLKAMTVNFGVAGLAGLKGQGSGGSNTGNGNTRGLQPTVSGLNTGGSGLGIGVSSVGYSAPQIAGLAAGYGAYKAVKSAANLEQALIAVAKTTDLSEEKLTQLKNQMIKLSSTDVSANAVQLLGYSAMAGTMGFDKKDDIAGMAESMARLAMSSDLKDPAAALKIGQVMNLTSDNNENFGKVVSGIVHLANETKTLESKILLTSTYVAQGLASYEVSPDKVLGLAAGFAETGTRAENARTGIQRSMEAVQRAAVNPLGDEMKVLTKVTKMSSKEIQKMYSNDRMGLIFKMAEGINDVIKANDLYVRTGGAKGSGVDIMETILKPLRMNDNAIKGTIATMGARADIFLKDLKLALDDRQIQDRKYDAVNKESAKAATALNVKIKNLANSFTALGDAIGNKGTLKWIGEFTDALSRSVLSMADAYTTFDRIVSEWSIGIKRFFKNEGGNATTVKDRNDAKRQLMMNGDNMSLSEKIRLKKVADSEGSFLDKVSDFFSGGVMAGSIFEKPESKSNYYARGTGLINNPPVGSTQPPPVTVNIDMKGATNVSPTDVRNIKDAASTGAKTGWMYQMEGATSISKGLLDKGGGA